MSTESRLIAIILAGLIALPLFFTVQIGLAALGLTQFTLDPQNADYVLRATPLWALIAPPLRVLILCIAFLLLARRSRWLATIALIDVVVHTTGWLTIISNASFTLPTGFISFGLQGALIYVLIQAGYFRPRQS
ncbi:hypothetical protein [uncultured Maricaulis sp.]|uniref:hypothetical protein n=1 Tax=uncultured Maricaulis sp. TaxID=174710 RepID=UPI002616B0F7|nr:hypothetical protein [uncultured Maricaulis sp.]